MQQQLFTAGSSLSIQNKVIAGKAIAPVTQATP
jgi:hypothetical protein